jgi:predicted ATPase
VSRAELQAAQELGEQLLILSQRRQDPALLLVAHFALGFTLYYLGEFSQAREHSTQGIALYDPQRHHSLASLYGQDLGVSCRTFGAWALWHLGYPDQALKRSYEALILAQTLSHPFSLAIALAIAAIVHKFRQEEQKAREQAEAEITLCTAQEIPFFLAWGNILRGGALAKQGQEEEGIAQMSQGLASIRALGGEVWQSYWLVLLVEAYCKTGKTEEGLSMLAEALIAVDKTGERFFEAELYRLKGELTLQQSKASFGQVSDKSQASQDKSENTSPQPLTPSTQAKAEAEACFLKAIEIARKQQAKSLELRATMSLARLWQRQDKKPEAHKMLSEIYNWFTEGFDTKDLQETKALLDSLESSV